SRDDRKFSVLPRHRIRGELNARFADEGIGRGREVDDATLAVYGRVVRNDFDAALSRTPQSGNEGVRVVCGHCDRIYVLGDQRVENFELTFRSRSRRACENYIDTTEGGGGFVATFLY